jgi:hypothetical protein
MGGAELFAEVAKSSPSEDVCNKTAEATTKTRGEGCVAPTALEQTWILAPSASALG